MMRLTVGNMTVECSTMQELQACMIAFGGIAPQSTAQINSPVSVTNVAQTSTTPTTPSTPKVYDAPTEQTIVWALKDNTVKYTMASGSSYVPKDVKAVVNARIKAAGFTWDKEHPTGEVYKKDDPKGSYKKGDPKKGAWVLMKGSKRDMSGAKAFVESASTTVSADELQAVRNGWAEKSAKRASKAK